MYKSIILVFCLGLVIVSAQTNNSGRAFYFNGTTGNYAIVNTFNGFPSSAFTIEFWMKTSDTTKEGTALSYATSTEDNMLFITDYRDFRFRLNGVAVPSSGGTGISVNDGQWHHIAFSWRNTLGYFLLYVDGVYVYDQNGVQAGFSIPSGGALVLGQEQDTRAGGFQASEAFLGTIDELRIWNVQRGDSEIRNDMHRSLTGNEPNLVLYYRMDEASGFVLDSSGDNHLGTLVGAARVASTAPVGLPVTAETLSVSGISTTAATLRGRLTPNGLYSYGFFEYGSNSLTTLTPRRLANDTTQPAQMSESITGLRPSTTYNVRFVGSNALGRVVGTTIQFSTFGPADVITGPATTVTSDSATLTGSINPRNSATTVHFQYGLTTGYGFVTPPIFPTNGVVPIPVSADISGLAFGSNYHFRCVASNSFGVTYGADRTFVTQAFGDVGAGLTGVFAGQAAWGDMDNDEDLDLIITGTSPTGRVTQVLLNNAGEFTRLATTLPNISDGSVAWGDMDGDGLLDLALLGDTGATRVAQIWRNYNGGFSNISAGLPNVGYGSLAWGDYDNDGDLDLIISGTTNALTTGAITQLFRNNGNGTFANVPTSLPGVWRGALAWGDYDNDGDLDLALNGISAAGNISQIWRNNGNSTFTDINAGLPGVRESSLAWGDFDNDGDLDLGLTGSRDANAAVTGNVTQIWRNDGGSSGFVLQPLALPPISGGTLAWGDYDNDGDLDLVICGTYTNGLGLTELYGNNGNRTFTKLNAALPGVLRGAVAWADYDNDGDLDFALLGQDSVTSERIAHIRRNDSYPANTVPQAPTNLVSFVSGSSLQFTWNRGDDVQTPSLGLTYSLQVNAVNAPEADLASGYRRIAAMGNVQHGTNATLVLSNFPGGTYAWTVQTVDSAFAGGPFASTNLFQLPGRPSVSPLLPANLTTHSATLRATANPAGRNTSVQFDFGTTTNYGTQLGLTNIGNAFSDVMVTADVNGLLPDTLYYFRPAAFNVFGAAGAADASFRTLFFSFQPPAIVAALPPGAATNISITLSNHIASAVNITNRFPEPLPAFAAIMNPTVTLAANGTASINLIIDATGLFPDTYNTTLEILSGSAHAVVAIPISLNVIAAQPADINSVSLQPNGAMLLDFSGTSGYAQTVFASTNLQDWVAIGPAAQISSGHFQFTDPNATNFSQRFYKIRTP